MSAMAAVRSKAAMRVAASPLVGVGGKELGCDGGQLAEFGLGEDGEKMLLEVAVMTRQRRVEGCLAWWCEGDGDGSAVGWVGFPSYESSGF